MKYKRYNALPFTLRPTGWSFCDITAHWSPVVVIGELVAGAPATILRHKPSPTFPLHVGAPLVDGCLTRVERLENGGVCVTVGDRGWLLVPYGQPHSSERRDAA